MIVVSTVYIMTFSLGLKCFNEMAIYFEEVKELFGSSPTLL